jgi:hypothetical protein
MFLGEDDVGGGGRQEMLEWAPPCRVGRHGGELEGLKGRVHVALEARRVHPMEALFTRHGIRQSGRSIRRSPGQRPTRPRRPRI